MHDTTPTGMLTPDIAGLPSPSDDRNPSDILNPLHVSSFVSRGPCAHCGSSDACSTYSDGHLHCFSCGHHSGPEGGRVHPDDSGGDSAVASRAAHRAVLVEPGQAQALAKRGLSEETCKKWGYTCSTYHGQPVQIANYGGLHGTVAQKLRFPNKDFKFLGDTSHAGLYGQHLWGDHGKMVVITEGEIDALSVSQIQQNKWPVVSVPNGAQGAKKAIQRALEWLEGYESVVFMFDMDDPGIKAAKECAEILTPGKAKIARLPLKDANEMLQAGRSSEVIDAIWRAPAYRPDGIISGSDLWQSISTPVVQTGVPYPWGGLNQTILGLRRGELITFCAGSGVGKSTVCRELSHYLISKGETVGIIALEENPRRTALGLMSIELNKRLHITMEGTSNEELLRAFTASVGSGRCFLYSHFGSLESRNLIARIRYMARGLACGWIILDHISIVVSGIGDGDERRLIDNTMTALRSLVEETGVGLLLVSHLKRPPDGGKSYNEGRQISLSDLRGSAAIEQLSDIVIGVERDQQGEAEAKNQCLLRVLKDRNSGFTGEACRLAYDTSTGRLKEAVGGILGNGGAAEELF